MAQNPSPTPTSGPTPGNCVKPLQALDPVALGLDPSVEDAIIDPTDDSDPAFSAYSFPELLFSATTAGVILPADGNYTISPNASMTADLNYDVSGCWGDDGAMVFAQPGLYTFLALANIPTSPTASPTTALANAAVPPGPAVIAGAGLAAKATNLCSGKLFSLDRDEAATYLPMTASVVGGQTALMIDDTNDLAILAAQKVLDTLQRPFQGIGKNSATVSAVTDMVTNIGTVFTNNASKPIVAVEIGHGIPNSWTNVGSVFQLNLGTTPITPSDALNTLETKAKGQINTFDVFSCLVSKGVGKTAPAPGHILNHLANNLLQGGGPVNVRGVNVPIFIIPAPPKDPRNPNAPQRPGSFQLKNRDKDEGVAASAIVSCQGGAQITCTVSVEQRLPPPKR